MLAHVDRVLSEMEAMRAELEHTGVGEKLIRIAAPTSAILRYYVTGFINSRPDILAPTSVREQGELEKLLLNGETDVVFTAEPFWHPLICTMLFCEEVLMISVPAKHPLASFDHLRMKDLDGCVMLMKPSLGLLQKRQDALIEREKVSLQIVNQEDYLIYREMARTSNLPYFTSSIARRFYEPSTHDRRHIPVDDPEVHLTYYLAVRTNDFADAMPFIDWAFRNRACHAEPELDVADEN